MKTALTCLLATATLLIALSLSAKKSSTMTQQTDTAAQTEKNTDVLVEMNTTEGQIVLRLYGDTPRHMENFVRLAREGYYDGLLFHRVIKDFMVQTGDPDSRDAAPGKMLGAGSPDYQIDAEIVYPKHFHRRGALAAARQGDETNPQRRSSGSQFYIVTGHKYTSVQLDKLEMNLIRQQKQDIINSLLTANRDTIMSLRRNRDMAGLQILQDSLNAEARKIASQKTLGFTPEQLRIYTEEGGAPHLDGTYTVFGQVEKGMDVIDRIQQAETDAHSRPKADIRIISMKIIQ